VELAELLNEKEWRTCRGQENATIAQQVEAFKYFCENYWCIKHPEKGRIKFELREAQLETIEAWMTNRYSIVLKARQIGFSTLAAAYAFWLVFFRQDRFVVMLSRTERESVKLLAKSKYGFRFLPVWMKERGPKQTTDRVIGLSTANGSGNFFHQLWVNSQTGTNQFQGIFFPWDADGERDEDWYTAKSRNMQPWQMHQEYPRFPEEAFIKSGNPVFDIDMLDEMHLIDPDRGYFHLYSDGNGEFRPTADGELSVWQYPEIDGVYVIGADVAEGLSYGDYSSAHIIDAATGIMVAHWHGHIEPDLFGDLLAELGWWYNTALLGVENNNHGLTTLKAAQKHGYRNLYKQRRMGHVRPEATEILGWRTTVTTKPLAIDELNANLRDGAIEVYCGKTIAELKTFVRKENGKMAGSPHDDRTISLAIANQMLKYVWLPEYRNDVQVPHNSMLWWEQHLFDPIGENKVYIGSHNVRKRTPF